ncbi:hypothetical protein ADK84_15040 [Streptomyces sp. NRRL WC-3701]|nr:hypothetical protein ADK84_15040 [Streptomyces sp. NRRL WC-3701]
MLSRAGVRTVIVEIGLNDLFKSPRQLDPEKLADGMREIDRHAWTRGIQAIGSTLTPMGRHPAHRGELGPLPRGLDVQPPPRSTRRLRPAL